MYYEIEVLILKKLGASNKLTRHCKSALTKSPSAAVSDVDDHKRKFSGGSCSPLEYKALDQRHTTINGPEYHLTHAFLRLFHAL